MKRGTWMGPILGGVIVIGLVAILTAIGPRPDIAPGPTPAPVEYSYALREAVSFEVDYTSQHGVCNNRYASGEVVDLAGAPVDGLQILIWAGAPPVPTAQSLGAITGRDPVVGAGRWHIPLMRLGDPQHNTVELRDAEGNLLAEPVPFSFQENCAENMAVLNFAQVRPDGG
jgi:hypothetical protein